MGKSLVCMLYYPGSDVDYDMNVVIEGKKFKNFEEANREYAWNEVKSYKVEKESNTVFIELD